MKHTKICQSITYLQKRNIKNPIPPHKNTKNPPVQHINKKTEYDLKNHEIFLANKARPKKENRKVYR